MKRLLPLLLAACVAASACSAVQADANAAVVNGQAITRSSFDGELNDLAANRAYVTAIDQQQGGDVVQATTKGTFTQSFTSLALTRRIFYTLIHQELARRHALPDASAIAAARNATVQAYTVTLPGQNAPTSVFSRFPSDYQQTLVERQADVGAVTKLLTRTATDQQVRDYYDSHQSQFLTEICVRHILVADQATAQKLKAQLDAGANFAALAKANSTDTGSAANGGALGGSAPDGCLTAQDASNLISAFVDAMLSLPLNQVSQPVQSQYGWHLIEVTSRKVEPFDQAQATARQAATQPSQQDFTGLLDTLVHDATIKVDPAFGHFEKSTANGPTVVPPTGPELTGTTLPGT